MQVTSLLFYLHNAFDWQLNPHLLFYQPLLPSPFTAEDAGQLLQSCLKAAGRSSAHVFCDSIVVSEQFLQNCKDPFQQLMQDKAKTVSVYQKTFIMVLFCQQQLSVVTKPMCLGYRVEFLLTATTPQLLALINSPYLYIQFCFYLSTSVSSLPLK